MDFRCVWQPEHQIYFSDESEVDVQLELPEVTKLDLLTAPPEGSSSHIMAPHLKEFNMAYKAPTLNITIADIEDSSLNHGESSERSYHEQGKILTRVVLQTSKLRSVNLSLIHVLVISITSNVLQSLKLHDIDEVQSIRLETPLLSELHVENGE